ncbi:MAG TPA: energy-coupling factor transporter transmembrane component T [Ktedonobacteraceae bacterium]|jgi:energy-coupling factor transport system permease protein
MEILNQLFLQNIVGRTIIGYMLAFIVPLILPVLFITLVGVQGLRHLFSYEPRRSIIHQLDPRLKVLYPFVIGILSVLLNWVFVWLLLVFTLIPWILVKTSPARRRVVLTMIITPALGLIWSQGLFHIQDFAHPNLIFTFPPTISWVGTPGLSATGLLFGVQQAGRVMASAAASLILLMTTRPSEIIWAFYKFRMPAAVGLAFTAALRFLPLLIERMTVLLQVMQVRGYDLTVPRWWQIRMWPGYVGRVFMCIPIVTIPLLISSLRSTTVMAMVADARAFGSQKQRTTLLAHETTWADRIALGALIGVTLTVVILLSLHIGNRQI